LLDAVVQFVGANPTMKKAGYLPGFFSFLAARFSFSDFSGFFYSVFFWSMPFMTRSAQVDG
jgi:hypothetical protein